MRGEDGVNVFWLAAVGLASVGCGMRFWVERRAQRLLRDELEYELLRQRVMDNLRRGRLD